VLQAHAMNVIYEFESVQAFSKVFSETGIVQAVAYVTCGPDGNSKPRQEVCVIALPHGPARPSRTRASYAARDLLLALSTLLLLSRAARWRFCLQAIKLGCCSTLSPRETGRLRINCTSTW
jgi:hypothetical protein